MSVRRLPDKEQIQPWTRLLAHLLSAHCGVSPDCDGLPRMKAGPRGCACGASTVGNRPLRFGHEAKGATQSCARQFEATRPDASCVPSGSSHDGDRHIGCSGRAGRRAGRTSSAITSLNLPGSSTNGSWPERSNQTSSFEGAASASKYATLVSAGTK